MVSNWTFRMLILTFIYRNCPSRNFKICAQILLIFNFQIMTNFTNKPSIFLFSHRKHYKNYSKNIILNKNNNINLFKVLVIKIKIMLQKILKLLIKFLI